MAKYILKRILQMIPMLLALSIVVFVMVRLIPGDPVTVSLGLGATQEARAAETIRLGLDKPIWQQYFVWLGNVLRGDLGTSIFTHKPVWYEITHRFPTTFKLAVLSTLFSTVFGILFGILAAVKQNRFTDYLIRAASFLGNSMPNFFVALLLMYFFAIRLNWFPVIAGGVSLQSVAMPSLTLAIAMSAKYLRQIRATVLDELSRDYVVGAKARGVKFSVTMYRSVLKASLVTIITLLTLSIGSLLGGTAIVESIFMWDGVGKMAVDAITMRDYPIIQAYVAWMAVIYVLVNLITDLIYHFLDPRVRLGEEER